MTVFRNAPLRGHVGVSSSVYNHENLCSLLPYDRTIVLACITKYAIMKQENNDLDNWISCITLMAQGRFSGTDVFCYHIFPIPVFRVLLRTCPDEPLSAGQFEDNCPHPNLFRDMIKAFNFKKYSHLFECMFDWNVARNERFWPFLAPPKRKVVGSNPARNANLEGGGRKNRFPLLLSQKTISV